MKLMMSVNAGSSSLKYQLIEMPEANAIAKGQVERIGLKDSEFELEDNKGNEVTKTLDIKDHAQAVELLFKHLLEANVIDNFDEIAGVGHRVVAGGEIHSNSVLIDEEVVRVIHDDLGKFAPLHNPAQAVVMKSFLKRLPNVPQVAVFDTAFHSTMPEVNYLYSLPYEYYEEYGARRYGFHGTSHKYISRRTSEILGKPMDELKIITAHLGNGASLTAVENGKVVDTSLGFTPLVGVTMGTRTGDIDVSLVAYLMEEMDLSMDEMMNILNNKSGLLGISGVSSDMREVMEAREEGNHRAALAYDIFINRIQKYIGNYVATMNGVDAIVFTAGIGENSPEVRQDVIDGVTFFGAQVDPELNDTRAEAIISPEGAPVAVLNVPTNEEVEIAREVVKFVDVE